MQYEKRKMKNEKQMCTEKCVQKNMYEICKKKQKSMEDGGRKVQSNAKVQIYRIYIKKLDKKLKCKYMNEWVGGRE